jgi:myo-inositol-1-phosphate synthase
MNRLGICIAGLDGAVASTMAAGAALLRRGLAQPLALLSEPYTQSHALARWNDIVLAGWDPRGEDLHTAALRNAVIGPCRLKPVRRHLAALKPWPAGADRIAAFRRQHQLDTVVILNLLPTAEHAASKQYARLAAKHGCPFVNFTPNDCGERRLRGVPFAGRDGKTGQTWFKSVLAPALRDRALRVTGWYSTNLLGNEDGKIVGDPVLGAAKIRDKSQLLGAMLGYEPHHTVRIEYFPPRGDTKESWDYIEAEGFLGQPIQFRISACYPDSILAAPMCLDLCRFIELAARRGERGNQAWLSAYFKAPYSGPPHDFFRQEQMLRNYLDSAWSSVKLPCKG